MTGGRATAVPRRRAGGAAKRRTKVAAALLALLTPPALAGCGIQKSDVVEAGGAATLHVQPILDNRIVLYFVGPDGRSMPVARDVEQSAPVITSPPEGSGGAVPSDVFGPDYEVSRDELRHGKIVTDKILAMLLVGPKANETAAGITTALPGVEGETPTVLQTSKGSASAGNPARRLIWVRTPFPVKKLSEAGVHQLVCTTAYAEDPAGLVEVSLSGPDGILPTARCDG